MTMSSIGPAEIIQFWEAGENADEVFEMEAQVRVTTKITAKGFFMYTCPLKHIAYHVDNPDTLTLKILGEHVPWDSITKTFQSSRYSVDPNSITFSTSESKPPGSSP